MNEALTIYCRELIPYKRDNFQCTSFSLNILCGVTPLILRYIDVRNILENLLFSEVLISKFMTLIAEQMNQVSKKYLDRTF